MHTVKLRNLDLSVKVERNDKTITMLEVYLLTERIGYITIENSHNNIYAFDTWIHKNYRRKGIATYLYDYAEELSQKKLFPYEYLNPDSPTSSDAIEFWRSRGLNLNDHYRLFD